MHIALVCPFDPRPAPRHAEGEAKAAHLGGVERVYAHVAEGLAARGHRVTVITSRAKTPGGRTPAIETRHYGHGQVRFVAIARRATLLRAPIAAFARAIPRDADVIQVPATYPFTTGPVLRRARQLRIPAILDFHFEPVVEGWGGRAAAFLHRLVAKPSYRRADLVLVRSAAYARSSPSLSAVPESRWRVVPNGVDAERFAPEGPGRTRPPLRGYLLFVGRLVPYKGVDVLIEALRRLPSPPPLVVAGDGPRREGCETTASRLGLDVHFLGAVDDDELPRLYRGAALTVLPSVNRQEAFGIVLLESMACGTPVVASALPGVADVARLAGAVARPGDPADLAATLKAALEPGALPAGPTVAARVRDEFAWPSIIDRVEAACQELVPGAVAVQEVLEVAHPRRSSIL